MIQQAAAVGDLTIVFTISSTVIVSSLIICYQSDRTTFEDYDLENVVNKPSTESD